MRYQKDDLQLTSVKMGSHLEDRRANRTFPRDYVIMETTVTGGNQESIEHHKSNPWDVLHTGYRKKLPRGNPRHITELRELEGYFPMQVELGCGPSIEAGIPALNYLHGVYYVTDWKTGRISFAPSQDKLLTEYASDSEAFYRRASRPYAGALIAEPTPFYRLLAELHQKRIVVGSVITNNFDGLSSRVGLAEKYVRKFNAANIVPHIKFDPDAKSLLVVGSHADRRRIQQAARQAGLTVIYVDPEGYELSGGFFSHPLEAPQDGDIVVNMTAKQFEQSWRKAFQDGVTVTRKAEQLV